jgi:hypothetical protein
MIIEGLRTKSESNLREHWAARAKRIKDHREKAFWEIQAWSRVWKNNPVPVIVTLTRLAPRELDDDNLRGALKGVRDGVADAFGINDRDPRVKWEYMQDKTTDKRYGVGIEIEAIK